MESDLIDDGIRSGATPTSDAVWSAQGTTPDAIEGALRDLLREYHADNGRFVPARALNMVAFVDHRASEEIANRLRGVGRYHASRLVLLSYEPDRERLDARAIVVSEGNPVPGEFSLLRETVTVEIGERHLEDLQTIVDPLVVTDLPTLLWSPHGHPEAVDELLALAQAMLVDSIDEPVFKDAIGRVEELSHKTYVVDLAWLRSTPWRERVAALFDPPRMRDHLAGIEAVTVRHHPESTVAAMLLIGWLSSRLGWRVDPLTPADGDSITGTAHRDGREIALRLDATSEQQVRGLAGVTLHTAGDHEVSLDRGSGGLRARLRQGPGAQEVQWTIPGASRGETGILGEGIRQALLRDSTYLPALHAAQAMVP